MDHEKLGLQRMILIAETPDPYSSYAQAIFAAMSELSYVVGFSRTLVGGEHIINVSAPKDQTGVVRDFFFALKDKGLFSSLEVLDFDWHRNVPMKAEYYDFDTGRWDFDWQKGADDYQSATYSPTSPCKFDYTDLLVIKELQMDANKSLKEISEKLQINYKKLAWHYTTHVMARRMLPGYTINWMGTRYDYTLEKVLHRKHRYFALDLFVRDVNDVELITIRLDINRLPLLWSEAVGRNYFAEFDIPVDNVVEGLQYLGNLTAKMKERVRLYPIDQTEAASFTVPYKLYDEQSKAWTFHKEELLQKFSSMMVEINEGTR